MERRDQSVAATLSPAGATSSQSRVGGGTGEATGGKNSMKRPTISNDVSGVSLAGRASQEASVASRKEKIYGKGSSRRRKTSIAKCKRKGFLRWVVFGGHYPLC